MNIPIKRSMQTVVDIVISEQSIVIKLNIEQNAIITSTISTKFNTISNVVISGNPFVGIPTIKIIAV